MSEITVELLPLTRRELAALEVPLVWDPTKRFPVVTVPPPRTVNLFPVFRSSPMMRSPLRFRALLEATVTLLLSAPAL